MLGDMLLEDIFKKQSEVNYPQACTTATAMVGHPGGLGDFNWIRFRLNLPRVDVFYFTKLDKVANNSCSLKGLAK